MNSLATLDRGITRASTSRHCEHASARHLRLYLSYAETNAIRLRASPGPGVHVSWLYEIPGGWGWTICRECGMAPSRR